MLVNIPEAFGSSSTGRKRYHLEVARGSSDEARAVMRRLVRARAFSAKSILRPSALTSAIAKMLTAWIGTLQD